MQCNWFLKFSRVSNDRIVAGSLFHDACPATANARSPKFLEILVPGTNPTQVVGCLLVHKAPVGHCYTPEFITTLLSPKLIMGGNYDRPNAVTHDWTWAGSGSSVQSEVGN